MTRVAGRKVETVLSDKVLNFCLRSAPHYRICSVVLYDTPWPAEDRRICNARLVVEDGKVTIADRDFCGEPCDFVMHSWNDADRFMQDLLSIHKIIERAKEECGE